MAVKSRERRHLAGNERDSAKIFLQSEVFEIKSLFRCCRNDCRQDDGAPGFFKKNEKQINFYRTAFDFCLYFFRADDADRR